MLAGLGTVKVQAIIRYRDGIGPFRWAEQLEEVVGNEPSIVKRKKTRIRVKTPES